MQERMQKAQDDLAKIEVTGEAGAGMVKVTMTCNHNVRRVDIDESLMDDDKDMVEDLVAGFNDSLVCTLSTQSTLSFLSSSSFMNIVIMLMVAA